MSWEFILLLKSKPFALTIHSWILPRLSEVWHHLTRFGWSDLSNSVCGSSTPFLSLRLCAMSPDTGFTWLEDCDQGNSNMHCLLSPWDGTLAPTVFISYFNNLSVLFEQLQNKENLCFTISKADFKNYRHVSCSSMLLKLLHFSLSGTLDRDTWTRRVGAIVPYSQTLRSS